MTVLSFIIVGYVRQVLGRGGFLHPPPSSQVPKRPLSPEKAHPKPSCIGLRMK